MQSITLQTTCFHENQYVPVWFFFVFGTWKETFSLLSFVRSLTDIRYQIHLHLCIALAMAQVVFLVGITATERKVRSVFLSEWEKKSYQIRQFWNIADSNLFFLVNYIIICKYNKRVGHKAWLPPSDHHN